MNKTKTFKDTIRQSFIVHTFIPIVILFILFLIFIFFYSKQVIINDVNKAANMLSESIRSVHLNYSEQINYMAKSNEVIDFVNTRQKSETIYETFYQFNSQQDVKSTFYIINKDGIYLTSTDMVDPHISGSKHEEIISRINKNPLETLREVNYLNYTNGRETVYTYGKAIMDQGEVIGYIFFHLLEQDLQKLLVIQHSELSFITDQHNRVVSASSTTVIDRLNKFNPVYDKKNIIQTDQGSYYIKEIQVKSSDFSVFTLKSIQYSKDIFIYLLPFLLITSIILWFLINNLAKRIAKKHSESIDKLLYAVRQLQEGKINSYVTIESGDEFEVLAEQYNVMVRNLEELIKKNKETVDVKRLIEIKKIQAQFNPHFIFNILETLRYALYIDIKSAEEIILKLSKLLRYSINSDGYKVVLEEDLSYIEDYLALQQFRFKERLHYDIRISNDILNAFVPRLLLQTIIENAIKHGFRHQNNLNIEVDGFIEEDKLILKVFDDGWGIEQEQLKEIRELMSKQENPTQHLGLYNIHRQLTLLYGKQYGINIDSWIGKGTLVTIQIPYEKEDVDV